MRIDPEQTPDWVVRRLRAGGAVVRRPLPLPRGDLHAARGNARERDLFQVGIRLDDLVRRGYEAPLPNHTSIAASLRPMSF